MAVHALLIAVAIVATMPATRRIANTIRETTVVFTPTVRPRVPAPAPAPHIASLSNVAASHWTFRVPTVVPPTIPPIEPGPVRNEETVSGLTTGVVGSSNAVAANGQQVFLPDEVERAVTPFPDNAPPRYPPVLQSAGVEGDVVAQFVVDTLGRVELTSIKMMHSAHDLFERAVREALARARYHSAQIGAGKVRQLVEQRFTFSIRAP